MKRGAIGRGRIVLEPEHGVGSSYEEKLLVVERTEAEE